MRLANAEGGLTSSAVVHICTPAVERNGVHLLLLERSGVHWNVASVSGFLEP